MSQNPPGWHRTGTPRRTNPKTGPDHGRTQATQQGHPDHQKEIQSNETTTQATTTHWQPRRRDKTYGIDFWHAVEFSRIRRAPHQAFRPSVGATVQTYPVHVSSVNFPYGLH